MTTISVPMNAVRVCNAIARIGYEPHSALMDIIDNSIAAEARNIHVFINLVEGKTINQRNNVSRYRITDDGIGMDEGGIINAFTLGSVDNYKPNCLSKYGMGLKSAGFSLGMCIQVISKRNNVLSNKYILDRKIIERENKYVACREDLTTNEKAEYTELLKAKPSGTVVEIIGCGEIYHTSAKTTIDKLKYRLGVTYYPFLSATDDKRLNIVLTYPGEDSYQVEPLDILFTSEASSSFDRANYQGTNPCYASNEEWKIPTTTEAEAPAIKLEVVTFPKAGMADATSPLDAEQKQQIKKYLVSRENKGFFVYRNGRLIRWGDDLEIIGKDQLGFRARMELTDDHDDLLHVDVSKQRLEMDDETRNHLKTITATARKQAEEMFAICDHYINKGPGEGDGFTATADSLPEEDPIEDSVPPDLEIKKVRAKKLEEESNAILKELGLVAEKEEKITPPGPELFKRVRYSDTLPGMTLWSAQKDVIQGTYVYINRRHPYYITIISKFEESSPERLALEAIIHCCAIGENKTYENLTIVDDGDIRKVFERFFTILSYNLGEWASGNQNIFEKI